MKHLTDLYLMELAIQNGKNGYSTVVYNPVHLGGFLSIINPNSISKMDLYKGGFPARFGGRLSSVLDVITKNGNQSKWKGTASIGLMTSGLSLEGPVIRDRLSVGASLRASYGGLLAGLFQDGYSVCNLLARNMLSGLILPRILSRN